jgi:tripartite-type tricarboxylate transporter receptor subunit TctC
MVVHPSLPARTLKEFVEYAKANPGKLNFSSAGIGNAAHLAGELLQSLTKIKMVHVPYKSGGLALTAVVGGEAHMICANAAAAVPQVQAGKVRALALLSSERLPMLSNVPTAREAGIDGFDVNLWYGLLAPAGTPREIINRLNTEWIKIEAKPETKEQIQKAGFQTLSGTPQRFGEFLKAEIARWGTVIREAKIPTLD